MNCLLSNATIKITNKKVIFNENTNKYYLEVNYSFGSPDLYGPFNTELDAQTFL
jgi:hypothetical protein